MDSCIFRLLCIDACVFRAATTRAWKPTSFYSSDPSTHQRPVRAYISSSRFGVLMRLPLLCGPAAPLCRLASRTERPPATTRTLVREGRVVWCSMPPRLPNTQIRRDACSYSCVLMVGTDSLCVLIRSACRGVSCCVFHPCRVCSAVGWERPAEIDSTWRTPFPGHRPHG